MVNISLLLNIIEEEPQDGKLKNRSWTSEQTFQKTEVNGATISLQRVHFYFFVAIFGMFHSGHQCLFCQVESGEYAFGLLVVQGSNVLTEAYLKIGVGHSAKLTNEG